MKYAYPVGTLLYHNIIGLGIILEAAIAYRVYFFGNGEEIYYDYDSAEFKRHIRYYEDIKREENDES